MSDKRYQIFVSSTFTDLEEERQKIFNAIQKLSYIPAGMEFFGAVDEEQLVYIKRIIDNSDYYVLIIGGRYGSVDDAGVSYTEREYDYAVEKKLKVIALIHGDHDSIPVGKTDKNDEAFNKLEAFKRKVTTAGRLVAFWKTSEELLNNFHSSLLQTTNLYPMTGWVRGDSVATTDALKELYELRLENQRLKEIHADGRISDLKIEVGSVTMPQLFSPIEIECVSFRLSFTTFNFAGLPSGYLKPLTSIYSVQDILIFFEKAFQWVERVLSTCRIDVRVTNPNSVAVRNIIGENRLFREDGTLITEFEAQSDIASIKDPPYRPDSGRHSSNSTQQSPTSNLNPHQSNLYTHHRYFIPQNEMTAFYERRITGENLPEPVVKRFKIHFRVKQLDLSVRDIATLIYDLERQEKLNDVSLYEYANRILLDEMSLESEVVHV